MGRYQLWNQKDINYMRQVQNANLPDQCVVERPTSVSDGEGGYTREWTTTYSGKCRMWISSGTSGTSTEARFWGDHEISMTECFIIAPWDADITVQDRITWTNIETGVVRKLEVVGTNKEDSVTSCTRARCHGIRGE